MKAKKEASKMPSQKKRLEKTCRRVIRELEQKYPDFPFMRCSGAVEALKKEAGLLIVSGTYKGPLSEDYKKEQELI